MKAHEITGVYKARLKKLSGYYQKVLKEFTVNDIHHFRTEMKKLRAFIRLIDMSSQDLHNKIPKELKKFYNTVGDIRNLQLQQERISQLTNDLGVEIPGLYMQYLKNEENSLKVKATQVASTIYLKDFEKKLIDSVPDNVKNEIKVEFLEKNKTKLQVLLTLPSYYDEALHELRKILKDLMYDFKYVKSVINIELPSLNSLKAMETLTNALGDFHDLCVALFLLSPVYIKQIPELDSMNILNEIQSCLLQKKEDLKEEIILSLIPIKQQIDEHKALMQPNKLFY